MEVESINMARNFDDGLYSVGPRWTATSIYSIDDGGMPTNSTVEPMNETCGDLLYLGKQAEYKVPIYGYLSPIVVLFTVITNVLICVILLRRHMRTPTNVLLVFMALSDLFTGLFPLPFLLYVYTAGRYVDYLPFDTCWMYKYLFEIIPTIFHTASIWLTVALACQRYVYICHSTRAREWCTIPNVIKATCIIYILSILSQLSRCLDTDITACEVPSLVNPNETITTCFEQLTPLIEANQNLYYNIFFWYRVVVIHAIPCVTLVVMNALLVRALRRARRRRERLLQQNRKSEWKKIHESNCTTLMLIAVVGVFLVVEVPMAISFILYIVQNTFELLILTDDTQQSISMIINFFILLSYPLNFFIYCAMSRQFRETFKQVVLRRPADLKKDSTKYTTLPTTVNIENTVVKNGNGVSGDDYTGPQCNEESKV
ncbi:sex peptide receptor-like [Lingula anatina]|uniref:Sex peptide receptor n=1 Tax=Lingula anatina TaxID=7574 RepID=A0A1S3HBL2_LINAN|nr:sex peptide receptor [Lingula anatina]XP_013383416.1 sex peptide receptor-like [Lingula anatina]XP_013383417.1 sex peptide receptor-like [Lingula anatina]XP_013383418.1 sex peptide receptor-like [Lingula anatina]|eukprot:XP_013383231.1 sex peptide receptor [Lingula anatina]